MKRFSPVILFLLLSVFFGIAGLIAEEVDGVDKTEMSYSFGMVIASDLVETELEFDYNAFVRGFRDMMEGEETMFTVDEALDIVNSAFLSVMVMQEEQRRQEGEKNRVEGEIFLAENAKRPGVEITPSGLQYELISEGNGEKPGPADTVLVHYRGETINGIVFDSSYERGEPLLVPLDRVIPGWSEGMRLTREGGKARLYIPPNLAYGEHGAGNIIAPNAVIVFDVELFTIIKLPEEEEYSWDE